ncbi:MAG: undecaprenyldiphospho-muramoylpentapeptide beta-N-acetylglucosaminyltransferase [Bacteroidales bacterium]|jgi:UDP-N-acetylglucosamine--N-acetylmuramyl-(pentapeptide) pyrophosphoryl-undecaprenol N-acetylglucosamine transferase|nr:undecaprenyldiphospho-muramoylpentapeptide beta-N-acetylglucosaminyltransferase [Bacteroidales bacterium]
MKVIISGGGTGGHIFPAIAIANAIKAKHSEADILFVGANGRMEMEKVPQAGYRIEGLNIAGFQRRLTWKNLTFPFKLWKSLQRAKKIIKEFNPDVVIGVGGYASGPTLQMATKLRIPCLIQEQNSYPGITNKLLSKKVQKICVAYEGMEKFFPSEKIVFTGNPIRQDISDLPNKYNEAQQYFNFPCRGVSHTPNNPKTLLVIGGSLGARTINESLSAMLPELAKTNLQVIWQTGKNFDITIVDTKKYPNVHITQFITRMDLAYSLADFIVSRAGALSISELCVVGKPSILIPSPNVSEDHQTKNAMALVNQNAALFVADKDAKTLLFSTISDLLNNTESQHTLSQNISKLAKTDSAKQIADIVDKIKKS